MGIDFEAKYQLKKMFIVSLRQMFANDAKFPYNDDDTLTAIMITNKMPINTESIQLPHIVWSGATYGVQQESLGNNFYSEVSGKRVDGVAVANAGRQKTVLINFATSIQVVSSVEDESATVADRIFDYLFLEYPDQLEAIGLFIESVSVGDTNVKSTTPNEQYSCLVSIQGHLRLSWTVTKIVDPALISAIKLNLTTY